MKAIYRGKFIAPNTYIRKETSKINNFHKRKLETEEQNKCKVRRIIKKEINEIENRKTLEKIKVKTIYLKR